MNRELAQEVLRLHRAGPIDPADAELTEALRMVQEDSALAGWWQDQQAFDRSVREALRGLAVPEGLAERILRERPHPVRFRWWQNLWIVAAAAALTLCAGVWFFQAAFAPKSEFLAFRNRLARAAVRDYQMSLVTNDLNAIRSYLAQNQAPADYQIPAPMKSLPGLGCGIVKWQGQPVSMVCFDRGRRQLLWLFVADSEAVPGAPRAAQPVLESVGKLTTATWMDGRKLYVLAVLGDQTLLRKYL